MNCEELVAVVDVESLSGEIGDECEIEQEFSVEALVSECCEEVVMPQLSMTTLLSVGALLFEDFSLE